MFITLILYNIHTTKEVTIMNLNTLAIDITKKEGKKISLPIGQIKELMKIIFHTLSKMDETEVKKILARYK